MAIATDTHCAVLPLGNTFRDHIVVYWLAVAVATAIADAAYHPVRMVMDEYIGIALAMRFAI